MVIQWGKNGGLVYRGRGRDKEVIDLRYFGRQTRQFLVMDQIWEITDESKMIPITSGKMKHLPDIFHDKS